MSIKNLDLSSPFGVSVEDLEAGKMYKATKLSNSTKSLIIVDSDVASPQLYIAIDDDESITPRQLSNIATMYGDFEEVTQFVDIRLSK
jgi:hypothetical protein